MHSSIKEFKCLRCIQCCIFTSESDHPLVFPWEKRLLEIRALNYKVEVKFAPRLVYELPSREQVVVLYEWLINGRCPFSKDSVCLIHGEHPLVCKMYPLTIGIWDRTLRISMQCVWVKENRWVLNNSIDLRKVFREELENALLAYIIIESVINAIEKDGGVLIRNKYDVELIDVDEVYDGINELWNVVREH
ncbi:MAG: YkgJ family cysteine cluster protein [Desulfurococcaceae archaeon]